LVRVEGFGSTFPDPLTRGVTEIKSGLEIEDTIQMQIQVKVVKMRGVSYNLVVNTSTRVSKDLQDAVAASGGTIVRFDLATGTFRPFP